MAFPSRETGWTNKLPMREGFYWLRVRGEFEPEVVRVHQAEGLLQIYIFGSEQPAPLEGGEHEWSGPIAPPG